MQKKNRGEALNFTVFKQMYCSTCEYLTCDSCFVPEFTHFLTKMDDYESCILCFGPTPYRLREPVHSRLYYVEGSGQMCERCFNQVSDST